LEELSIGRPSNYASIISKIMEDSRGYVSKENREGTKREYKILSFSPPAKSISSQTKSEIVGVEKQKLFAGDIGLLVTDFLSEHFKTIMDYKFTANVEHKLDLISEGKNNWVQTLDEIYKPFHTLVASVAQEAERATGERILGKHPQSGLTVLVRMGKYGKIAQIGATGEIPENQKPQYANLKEEQSLEEISLEEALELFKLPKNLGMFNNQLITLGTGRYGLYLKYGETYVNLPKDSDPDNVDYETAMVKIQEKLAADAPIGYYEKKPITKGAGRFGPFVKWNDTYISIPKRADLSFETITEAQACTLIAEKLDKEANRYIQQWADYDLAIENGRWGPFIRQGKNNFKLLIEGKKLSPEQAATVTLQQVIDLVKEQGGTVADPKAKAEEKPKAEKKPRKKG